MKLVDTNVLLYAVNTDARHHERSRHWLDTALSGEVTVAFAWIALIGFVRLSTKAGMFPTPLTTTQAFSRVDAWLQNPASVVVQPTPDHARIVRSLLESTGTGGNLVNDAHLAALALEHRCEVVSFDNDFDRFEGVRWESPPE